APCEMTGEASKATMRSPCSLPAADQAAATRFANNRGEPLFDIIIVLLGGGDFLARGRAALVALCPEDGPPEVQLRQVRNRRLIELRTGNVELVAVGQDLAADQVPRQDRLHLLDLVVANHRRRLLGGGVGAAAGVLQQRPE